MTNLKALLYCKQRNDIVKKFYFQGVLIKVSYSAYQRLITIDILYTLDSASNYSTIQKLKP